MVEAPLVSVCLLTQWQVAFVAEAQLFTIGVLHLGEQARRALALCVLSIPEAVLQPKVKQEVCSIAMGRKLLTLRVVLGEGFLNRAHKRLLALLPEPLQVTLQGILIVFGLLRED
jgi:hypothetical protein